MEVTFIRVSKPISTLISSTGKIRTMKFWKKKFLKIFRRKISISVQNLEKARKNAKYSDQSCSIFFKYIFDNTRCQIHFNSSWSYWSFCFNFRIFSSHWSLQYPRTGWKRSLPGTSQNQGSADRDNFTANRFWSQKLRFPKVFQRSSWLLSKWHKVGQVACKKYKFFRPWIFQWNHRPIRNQFCHWRNNETVWFYNDFWLHGRKLDLTQGKGCLDRH